MLQLHYTNNVVRLAVNYRCIIVGCRKQLWGVVYYLVLLVLREVTVGHIACGRLHVTKFVFPDIGQRSEDLMKSPTDLRTGPSISDI
jgi:hypothetical protein